MAAGGASGIMRFLLPSQALPPEPPPDPTIMPTEPVMIEYLRSIKAKIDGSIKFSKNKTFVGKIEGVFPYDDITISPPDPIVLIGKSRQQVDRTTFYYKTVHVWCPEYFSKSDFTHEGKTLVKCVLITPGGCAIIARSPITAIYQKSLPPCPGTSNS